MNISAKNIGLIFVLLLSSLLAEAKEWTVCLQDCGITTIQQAIDKAKPSDTITIKAGLYMEPTIQVKKKLLIRGEKGAILDGQGENEIMIINTDSVVVRGLTFQNTGISFLEDRAAIYVAYSRGVTVEGNILKNTFYGIYLEQSNNCRILNNQVYGEAEQEANSGNAIHLYYSDSATIVGNQAYKHRDGIYLEFVNDTRVENNISRGNVRYGLHFMFADRNQYIQNTFEQNGAGVAVMFSHNIVMLENKFLQNWGTASYGLLLKEIYDSEIKNNTFNKNTVGIFAEGVTRCKVYGNTFSRNGWALRMAGSSMDNTFKHNNFVSNTFDVSTNSRENYNTYTENYWSEYSGYDLDRDGKGDVPYRPVKLFSYIISEVDASVMLLRSFFIDVLNYAEKIVPSLTPATLLDEQPLMRPVL